MGQPYHAGRSHCSLPELAFEGEALTLIRDCGRSFREGDACVIGGGDNYAAVALAGLGMSVTFVDISQNQLDIAGERAAELGLQMLRTSGGAT